jgi:membrane-bound lytic murein transglycosylase A
VPKGIDPVERGRKMPLPDPRPSEKIARLFPQTGPAGELPKDEVKQPAKDPPKDQVKAQAKDQTKDEVKDQKAATPFSPAATVAQATSPAAADVPLPEPRPKIALEPELPRHHYIRRYHHSR